MADNKPLEVQEKKELVAKGDLLLYDFPDFHYGNLPVFNDRAVFGTLAIEALF